MIAILAFIANVMYVYGAGVPLSSAKVKYDPITKWRQDLYVSRGTEGHGSPTVSFISGIIGAFLAGVGGALVYFALVKRTKRFQGFLRHLAAIQLPTTCRSQQPSLLGYSSSTALWRRTTSAER